jgi:hypothetical protein
MIQHLGMHHPKKKYMYTYVYIIKICLEQNGICHSYVIGFHTNAMVHDLFLDIQPLPTTFYRVSITQL